MLTCIEGFLNAEEVQRFREQLETAQWQDGASTAGAFARTQKHNEQLDESAELAVQLGNQILRKLGSHALFLSAALPQKIYPPRFNRYSGGGNYGAHVDSAVMRIPGTQVTMRTDLSATLFLCAPDEYDGGELQIETAFGAQQVKLAAGDMVLYPSTSLHRVTPVTRGARLASFFWVESLVADNELRTLLFDLDQSIQGLAATVPSDDPQLLRLSGVYHNLLRRYAHT
jgi:PKHD-type hydroxylase